MNQQPQPAKQAPVFPPVAQSLYGQEQPSPPQSDMVKSIVGNVPKDFWFV